jgi:ABC-2 type transport system ATP-binding protein
MTVLWATHLTDEVYDTDRLFILHRGKILQDGITRDIVGDCDLKSVFLSQTGAEA